MSDNNRQPYNQFKENNSQNSEQNSRNPNRQFFQKQGNNGVQSNQGVLSTRGQMVGQNNNFGMFNEQQAQNKEKGKEPQLNPQNISKLSSGQSRRKIFSQDEDALSVISQQTSKQSDQYQNRQSQQMFAPSGNQIKFSQQQQSQQQQQQQQQQQIHQSQQNIQQMYSDLLQKFNQLQEVKQAAEQTHNLEIEDTKKHYEFKLSESQRKQQELVIKLQNQQQSILQTQSQLKNLQEEIANKEDEFRMMNEQMNSTNNYQEDLIKTQEQKAQLEKIISDGKIYIEKIKQESEQKSQEILKLNEDFSNYQNTYNQQQQQIEINSNNCQTLRSEIQQLIASNLDLQQKVEIERKDKEQKTSEYQKIISRVNQNYTLKAHDEENSRKIQDLEINLKNMIDRNNELTASLKEKQMLIEKCEVLLKQKGITQQQINSMKNQQLRQNNYQGLRQITEEQDEDSFVDISNKFKCDINTKNIEELRKYTFSLLDNIENIKSQLHSAKQTNNLFSKENDILRASSQLAVINPNLQSNSSQTYLDRIKELNTTIQSLQKEKETLIYENTVIVNQMKKERQNREEEIRLFQNQIKNYQKLSMINTTPQTQIPQQAQELFQESHVIVNPVVKQDQYSFNQIQQQQNSFNTSQIQSEQSFNVSSIQQLPSTNVSIVQPQNTYTSKLKSQITVKPPISSFPIKPPITQISNIPSYSQIQIKPPTTLTQQYSMSNLQQGNPTQDFQSTSELLINQGTNQYIGKISPQIQQNQISSMRRTASYDGLHQFSNQNQVYSQNMITYKPSVQGLPEQSIDENELSSRNDIQHLPSYSIPQNNSYVILRSGEYIPTIQQHSQQGIKQSESIPTFQHHQLIQPQVYQNQIQYGQYGEN